MEGIYSLTPSDLWSTPACGGAQTVSGDVVRGLGRELDLATAAGAPFGPAGAAQDAEFTGALPNGLYAALDELAAAIGLTAAADGAQVQDSSLDTACVPATAVQPALPCTGPDGSFPASSHGGFTGLPPLQLQSAEGGLLSAAPPAAPDGSALYSPSSMYAPDQDMPFQVVCLPTPQEQQGPPLSQPPQQPHAATHMDAWQAAPGPSCLPIDSADVSLSAPPGCDPRPAAHSAALMTQPVEPPEMLVFVEQAPPLQQQLQQQHENLPPRHELVTGGAAVQAAWTGSPSPSQPQGHADGGGAAPTPESSSNPTAAALQPPAHQPESDAQQITPQPADQLPQPHQAAVSGQSAPALTEGLQQQPAVTLQSPWPPQPVTHPMAQPAPLPPPAPPVFKAPTIASLRAMRNSAAAAAPRVTAPANTSPATGIASEHVAAAAPPAPVGTADAVHVQPGPNSPSGAGHDRSADVSLPNAGGDLQGRDGGDLQGRDGGDLQGRDGGPIGSIPALQVAVTGVAPDPLSQAAVTAAQVGGNANYGGVLGVQNIVATAATATASTGEGELAARARSGYCPVDAINTAAADNHCASAPVALGDPLAAASDAGALPSLLSADPEELAAAIAAAVAAVAAATRAATEAAGQQPQQQPQEMPAPQAVRYPQQPQQQPEQLAVLAEPSVPLGGEELQQQQQQQQQQVLYGALPSYELQMQVQPQQLHPQQLHPQQLQPQQLQPQQLQPQQLQPQQLQVQFVPSAHGGGGVLQVVAVPVFPDALPPAAAALLGSGLTAPAVMVAGQTPAASLQQPQYGEVAQFTWPAAGTSAPAVMSFNPSTAHVYPEAEPTQQQYGSHPSGHDPYLSYQHRAEHHQDHQSQQQYGSYQYDTRNPAPTPTMQHQPQQPHPGMYGRSQPEPYDSGGAHMGLRHPTPYIYRPPAVDPPRPPSPSAGSYDSWDDGSDPRTRVGYVPLKRRGPAAPEVPGSGPAPDGWRSTGRRTGPRQHPQHLLWSPPPSVMYTPTRDYGEDADDSPPPEQPDGENELERQQAGAAADGWEVGREAAGAGAASSRVAGDVARTVAKAAGAAAGGSSEEGSPEGSPPKPTGPCAATVNAIQLIEARRKAAREKEQQQAAAAAAKAQAAREQQQQQQGKEKEQAEAGEPVVGLLTRSRLGKGQAAQKLPGKEESAKAQTAPEQTGAEPPRDVSVLELQTSEEQHPEEELQEEHLHPTERDQEDTQQEPPAGEQEEEQEADAAVPQRLSRAELSKKLGGAGAAAPAGVAAGAGDVTDLLAPRPLGRTREQARAEMDAATQAMLEKARRLRHQQLQERAQQERQRREAEEARVAAAKAQKEQEEERLRERLQERLSQQQQQRAKSAASASAPAPVLAKPKGAVAAALAARLAAGGKDAAVAVAPGAQTASGTAAATTGGCGGGSRGGSGILTEKDLQELEAELTEMEQQIAAAPTHGGINARALVLRAAELVAKRKAALPAAGAGAAGGAQVAAKAAPAAGGAAAASAAADPSAGLITVVKPLADAVPVPERTFVTYVPRSAIPRLVRQEAAHSLTGSYLAIALQRARVPEARAVQAVSSEPELRKVAVAAAGQHETTIYRQVTSKMNYELLFRKAKAEPERLQLPEELVQSLGKKYGGAGGAVKTKTATGNGGAATTAAGAAAAPGKAPARPGSSGSGAVAGASAGAVIMPGTKRRLASADDAAPGEGAAGAPAAKRAATAAATGAGASATAARGQATAGGSKLDAPKERNGTGKSADAGAAAVGAAAKPGGDAAVEELFEDSDPDGEAGGIPTGETGGGSGGAADLEATADVAVRTGSGGLGPVQLTDSAAAAIAAALAAPAGAAAVGAGSEDGEDVPDAPYEDLFGSDSESGAEHEKAAPAVTQPPAAQAPAPVAKAPSLKIAERNPPAAPVAGAPSPVGRTAGPGKPAGPRQGPATHVHAAAVATVGRPAGTGAGAGAAAANSRVDAGGAGALGAAKSRRQDEPGLVGSAGRGVQRDRGGGAAGRQELNKPDSKKRSRSPSGPPLGGPAARGLESKGSGGTGREGAPPLKSRGSGSLPPAAAGKQGRGPQGQTAQPQPQLQPQPQPQQAGGPMARGNMSSEEWEQTEPRQKLRQQVRAFVHATLEPLYRAGLLGKEPFKRVAAKCAEKLMAAHADDTTADFLVREHAQVSKFIMKMVEREQQREADQRQQPQQQ